MTRLLTPLVQAVREVPAGNTSTGRFVMVPGWPDFTPVHRHSGNAPQLGNTRPPRKRRREEPAYEW